MVFTTTSNRFVPLCVAVALVVGAIAPTPAEAAAKPKPARAASHKKKRPPPVTAFPHAHYKVEQVIKASPMHGATGLAFGPNGGLYAASPVGRAVYQVNAATGGATVSLGPPRGGAGDLAFSQAGTLAWVAPRLSSVFVRNRRGAVRTVAENIPHLRAVNFAPDGRLFFSAIAENDGLFEADISGKSPPRLVMSGLGGVGAFQIDKADVMYAPLQFRGKVVKINLKTHDVTDVASGFAGPTAVRLAADGALIVVDHPTGQVIRIDRKTGDKTVIATLEGPADALAIAKNGTLYVAGAAFNTIAAINPETKAVRRVTWGGLSGPGSITVIAGETSDQLLIADMGGARLVDPASGAVKLIKRDRGLETVTAAAVRQATYILGSTFPEDIVQITARDTGEVLAHLTNFGAPYDVKPLPDGFVVADYAVGRLTKVADDVHHTRTTLAWGFDGPVGLADGGNGTFYVSEYDGGRITRVATATNTHVPVLEGLNKPEGLALAPDGRLIVAEAGAGRVIAINLQTNKAEILADGLALNFPGDQSGPGLLAGVAVTRDGVIYVTGAAGNVLYRLTRP
jgi:sugar lactone lactonase YvrE